MKICETCVLLGNRGCTLLERFLGEKRLRSRIGNGAENCAAAQCATFYIVGLCVKSATFLSLQHQPLTPIQRALCPKPVFSRYSQLSAANDQIFLSDILIRYFYQIFLSDIFYQIFIFVCHFLQILCY